MNDEASGGRHPSEKNAQEAGSLRADGPRVDKSRTTRRLQLTSAGPLLLGIFDDEIATIAEWRRPTPLPQSPPAVLGVVSIEGRMLTVLDPLSLFGKTNGHLAAPAFLVALRGDEQIALAINSAGETIDLVMDQLQPPSDSTNRALGGFIQHDGQMVNVILVKGLFPAALRGRERRRRRFRSTSQ
jgi:chemotaxis signal transduction protein